jgi:uncharacterized oligopeptide transporter (OPT) family protein
MLMARRFTPYVTQLFQMLGSAVVPGSSQANMYFELYSGTALFQAASMLQDLKLGQYTKLPPRKTFTIQMVGTIVYVPPREPPPYSLKRI